MHVRIDFVQRGIIFPNSRKLPYEFPDKLHVVRHELIVSVKAVKHLIIQQSGVVDCQVPFGLINLRACVILLLQGVQIAKRIVPQLLILEIAMIIILQEHLLTDNDIAVVIRVQAQGDRPFQILQEDLVIRAQAVGLRLEAFVAFLEEFAHAVQFKGLDFVQIALGFLPLLVLHRFPGEVVVAVVRLLKGFLLKQIGILQHLVACQGGIVVSCIVVDIAFTHQHAVAQIQSGTRKDRQDQNGQQREENDPQRTDSIVHLCPSFP